MGNGLWGTGDGKSGRAGERESGRAGVVNGDRGWKTADRGKTVKSEGKLLIPDSIRPKPVLLKVNPKGWHRN